VAKIIYERGLLYIIAKKLNRKPLPFLIAVGYFLVATYLLTLPGSQFPKITWMDKIPLFDKWVHIGLFSILTFLWCRVVKTEKAFLSVAIISLLYGIVIEFIQHYFIPYRGFEGWDILADAVGCAIGFLAAKKWLLKIT
jgi:VanZ family protein